MTNKNLQIFIITIKSWTEARGTSVCKSSRITQPLGIWSRDLVHPSFKISFSQLAIIWQANWHTLQLMIQWNETNISMPFGFLSWTFRSQAFHQYSRWRRQCKWAVLGVLHLLEDIGLLSLYEYANVFCFEICIEITDTNSHWPI